MSFDFFRLRAKAKGIFRGHIFSVYQQSFHIAIIWIINNNLKNVTNNLLAYCALNSCSLIIPKKYWNTFLNWKKKYINASVLKKYCDTQKKITILHCNTAILHYWGSGILYVNYVFHDLLCTKNVLHKLGELYLFWCHMIFWY